MSTTSLVVELVVIGAGAVVWVGLLILAAFGTEWLRVLAAGQELALPMLLPALSLTYVLGILVDRLADGVFVAQAARLRARWFPRPEDYRLARTLIYLKSESLRDLYEYSRSRLRICRGWTVNAVLILVTFNVFVARTVTPSGMRASLLLFGNVAIALLAFWAWWAWRSLVIGEYTTLHEQRSAIREWT